MPAQPAPGRIPELDGLRGSAIFIVLVGHYLSYAPPTGALGALAAVFSLSWTGVDLFFVLSGFLIGGILLDVRASPSYFQTFYLRRFFRIVPLYYAWVLGYILLVTLGGAFVRAHTHTGGVQGVDLSILGHFLFLQNFGNPLTSPISDFWFGAMWSLAVEEQFYLLSPLLVKLLSRRVLKRLLIAIVIGAPLFRILLRVVAGGDSWAPYRWMPSRADALGWGMLLAVLWRDERARAWLAAHISLLKKVLVVLLAGMVVVSVWFSNPKTFGSEAFGYSWTAIFYSVMLLLALLDSRSVLAKVMRLGWLRELGRVSYCMYIIHMAVFLMCSVLLLHQPPRLQNGTDLAVAVLAGLLTYGFARLSWQFFEHPLLQVGHKFKYSPAPAPPAASAALIPNRASD